MNYKTFHLYAFAVLFLFSSCEKIEDLTTFDISKETKFTIPSQGLIKIPVIIQTPEVNTSAEQTFKNNNTRADLVETAYLAELDLTILSPQTQNFDFLNDIRLYIKDEAGEEALLAYKQNIPEDGARVLELEVSQEDLKPFIKQESFSIRTEVTTDQILNNDVEIQANMTFRVKAKIF